MKTDARHLTCSETIVRFCAKEGAKRPPETSELMGALGRHAPRRPAAVAAASPLAAPTRDVPTPAAR